jgi:hypothetical protein
MADEFKETLKEKVKAMGLVEKRYAATVGFKSGDPAICALYKIGLAYHNMAEAVVNAPMPAGAPPELQDAIREELAGQSQPIKDKAAEAFTVTVQKAQELDIFNDCFKKSLAMLRDTYRPQQFPKMNEEVVDLPSVASASAVGQGVLTDIQAVPVISKQQAAEHKEKAEALKDDLSGLENAPSDVRPASATQVNDSEPAAPKANTKSKDAEPEDLL